MCDLNVFKLIGDVLNCMIYVQFLRNDTTIKFQNCRLWVYDLFVNLKGHNILSYFPGQKIKTPNKFLEMTNQTWAVAAASYYLLPPY